MVILNQNSEIFEISEFFDVVTVSMGFRLILLPRPDDESSGYSYKVRSSGLQLHPNPLLKQVRTKPKIPARFGVAEILVFARSVAQDLLRFDCKRELESLFHSQSANST